MLEFIAEYWLDFVLGILSTCLVAYIKKLHKKNNAIANGMLSLLRAELIRSGEKYIVRGSIPIYAKDAYDKAYIAYHELGGNGTITELHETVMELSIKGAEGGEKK